MIIPEVVRNRVLQLDGDMLCYDCGHDNNSSFAQCTLNFEEALKTCMAMSGSEYCNIHLTGANSGRLNTALVMPLHLPALRLWVTEHYEYSTTRQVTGNAHSIYHNTQQASDGITQRQIDAIQADAGHLSIIMSRDNGLAMLSGLHCDWSTYEIKETIACYSGLLGRVFSWLLMQGQRITSTVLTGLTMLSILAVALPSMYYLKRKKRRATRAILYLQRIAYDVSIEAANDLVLALDAGTLVSVQGETNVMLYDIYDGNESAVIRHAILEGFRG